MNEYLFDVKLWASIRIKAADEKHARRKLKELTYCAPVTTIDEELDEIVTFEVSTESGDEDLVEVNGEAV